MLERQVYFGFDFSAIIDSKFMLLQSDWLLFYSGDSITCKQCDKIVKKL